MASDGRSMKLDWNAVTGNSTPLRIFGCRCLLALAKCARPPLITTIDQEFPGAGSSLERTRG